MIRRDSSVETWQSVEKPCLGEPGTSPSELKTCEDDEDGMVEDGNSSSDRSDTLRHDEVGLEIRLQMLEISLDSLFNSGSRVLFPLGRNPQHVLPRQGYSRRVETLRLHLVDDALSALNWLSGKRGPLSFAHNQMQDACSLCDAGGNIHRRCVNFCRGFIQGLTGSRRL